MKVGVELPLTDAPAVLAPVAGFIHSTAIVPLTPERFTVKFPPDGA
jgi:hypothetical protein